MRILRSLIYPRMTELMQRADEFMLLHPEKFNRPQWEPKTRMPICGKKKKPPDGYNTWADYWKEKNESKEKK